jgi:Plavaka transposase
MARQEHFSCNFCNRSFKTRTGLTVHITKLHWHPKPLPPWSTFQWHPHLTAQPCDEDGDFVPPQTPPPDEDEASWAPFQDRTSFKFAELTYKKMQVSTGNLNTILQLWAAHSISNDDSDPVFSSAETMYEAIDNIAHGNAPWESFSVRYPGPATTNSPSWQCNTYEVHCRNVRDVVHNMLKNKDFDNKFDYVPFQEYKVPRTTQYSNLMSGQWAYTKAVCV